MDRVRNTDRRHTGRRSRLLDLPVLLLIATLVAAWPSLRPTTAHAMLEARLGLAGSQLDGSLGADLAQLSARPGDDGEGKGGGGNEDEVEEQEWEGRIAERPTEGLLGTWTILTKSSKEITVIADESTRFDPPDAAAFMPDRWVEVDGVTAPDGQSVHALRIRADDYEAGEVVVKVNRPTALAELLDDYDLAEKSLLLASAGIYLLQTLDDDEPNLAKELAKDPRVAWAEVNRVQEVPKGEGYKTWSWGGQTEPDDLRDQDAFAQVGLPAVLAHSTYDGSNVVVAVLDTGVYTAHEQFQGRLILPSLDVIDDDTLPDDVGPGLGWGHGTHVAGIVAVMAPGAKILPVRVLDSGGRGNTFLLAYAIEWAVGQGANVLNLSLGAEAHADGEPPRVLQEVIERALAKGVVVVAAAGNNGIEQIQYPSGYTGVVGVTSVTYSEAEGVFTKSSFANYGAAWVDLAAPGESVMSAMIAAEGSGYAAWSGTSMSTAFVSGAAALARQKLDAEPNVATPKDVAEFLVSQGTPLPEVGAAWDGKIGLLLDVDRAILGEEPVVQGVTLYLPALQR